VILRDPVHGLVSFEAPPYTLVPALLATREVQRLRRIRQLGLAALVYPGAEHSRFSHAIGAAHVMMRLIQRLEQVHHELPPEQRVTGERARELVAAALLHDVGHGPLSHLFEDALPNAPCHEEWTRRILMSSNTEVHQVLVRCDPGLPERVCELIAGRHSLPYLAGTVSGLIDVDRCDYLLRDAHFTGVTYGQFDLAWLLRSLRLGVAEGQNAPALAIDGVKGLPAIESFVLARLFMFQQVYFHKAARASEWHVSSILARLRTLLENGDSVTPLPPAMRALVLNADASLEDYLRLDDGILWHCFDAWTHARDPILSDLCRRLQSRKLFKTLELYGAEPTEERWAELLERARTLAARAGMDPVHYVGLDEPRDVPFDSGKDRLRVLLPDRSRHKSYAPEDVSFVLGRLRGQDLVRRRLVYPRELRDSLLCD
jgi:uncharacterized protein